MSSVVSDKAQKTPAGEKDLSITVLSEPSVTKKVVGSAKYPDKKGPSWTELCNQASEPSSGKWVDLEGQVFD